MNKRLLRDRFRGCLVGGAAGDALGYPVEFQHETEIRSRYGAFGITGYELFKGFDKALVTDDTQMTLFTAEGILRANVRGIERGVCDPVSVMRSAYYRWLKTQGGRIPEVVSEEAFTTCSIPP